MALRSAGFPASGVLDLADSRLSDLADALITAGGDAPPAAEDDFRRSYDEALVRLGRRLQEIARSPRFTEAVTWQNHRLVETALEPLLRWHPARGRGSKHRGHEEVVASYWQRYCVKNDTIGFFGPLGWGELTPELPGSEFSAGEGLLAASDVYFESWPLDVLGAAIEEDARIRQWLPVRRVPLVRIERSGVHLPAQPPLRLEEPELAVLRACEPGRRACDVAAAVREAAALEPDDVYAILERLAARRLVVWKLEVPIDLRPERALRKLLERIDDPELRRPALQRLRRLEEARDCVTAATGDPRRLRTALLDLDSVFSELTSAAPVRHAGQTYAGRTIVYYDGRRDIELRFGRRVLDALAPVGLLLEGARWLTREAAGAAREALLEVYERLRAETRREISLGAFWVAALPALQRAEAEIERRAREYQRRWEAILLVPPGESCVRYSAANLVEPVRRAFATRGSAWSDGRYCSVDILLAATSVEDVSSGDFEIVVGEMHPAVNALRHACFVAQHPEPARLLAALEADSPRPRVVPVLPKDSPPALTTRLQPALRLRSDCHVALFHHAIDATRWTVVPAAHITVERDDGTIVGRRPTGERFDILDVLGEVLTGFVLHRARLFGDGRPHVPRIAFDRVVVSRETWCFDPAGDLGFATEADEAARFVATRRWRRDAGLPRQVFVKTPLEQKPFYVDFDSPICVNILAKAIRRLKREAREGETISISEMLPRTDQSWVSDRQGHRYTSEIRLVAVDLMADGTAEGS